VQHQAALPLHDQFSAAHWNRQGDNSSAHAFCCLKASANTTPSGLMARSSTYSALTMRLSPSTTLWDIKRFCTFAARARGRSAVHASVLPRRPCSTASLKKPVRRPLLEFVFLFEFDLFSLELRFVWGKSSDANCCQIRNPRCDSTSSGQSCRLVR